MLNVTRLVPNHIAGFAVMYGIFLAFGVSTSSLSIDVSWQELTQCRKSDQAVRPKPSPQN